MTTHCREAEEGSEQLGKATDWKLKGEAEVKPSRASYSSLHYSTLVNVLLPLFSLVAQRHQVMNYVALWLSCRCSSHDTGSQTPTSDTFHNTLGRCTQ